MLFHTASLLVDVLMTFCVSVTITSLSIELLTQVAELAGLVVVVSTFLDSGLEVHEPSFSFHSPGMDEVQVLLSVLVTVTGLVKVTVVSAGPQTVQTVTVVFQPSGTAGLLVDVGQTVVV